MYSDTITLAGGQDAIPWGAAHCSPSGGGGWQVEGGPGGHWPALQGPGMPLLPCQLARAPLCPARLQPVPPWPTSLGCGGRRVCPPQGSSPSASVCQAQLPSTITSLGLPSTRYSWLRIGIWLLLYLNVNWVITLTLFRLVTTARQTCRWGEGRPQCTASLGRAAASSTSSTTR